MRPVLALLLLMALPAWPAATPSGCGRLCGEWQLDAARSDPVETRIDEALQKYKPPRSRQPHMRTPENLTEAVEVEAERSMGPIYEAPGSAELRAELLGILKPAASLALSGSGRQIEIRVDGRLYRRYEADRPHSRVDALGTAEIRTRWTSGTLVITERYDRKHSQKESYTLRDDATLEVIREVERPGLRAVRVSAIYVRQAPRAGGAEGG